MRHIPSTNGATTFPGDSPITVTTRVTNTSKLPGDEVVELYISHPNTDGAPIRALAGFQRIHLNPGASQTVSFLLTPRELSIVTPAGQRQVQAGPIDLWLGTSPTNKSPTAPPPPALPKLNPILHHPPTQLTPKNPGQTPVALALCQRSWVPV